MRGNIGYKSGFTQLLNYLNSKNSHDFSLMLLPETEADA